MATHSSILAWEILWTEEPGGLQSMGSQRVGNNSVTPIAHQVKTLPANAGDTGERGLIPGLGRSPAKQQLEEEMAAHSRTPAQKIPRTEEPDVLESTGLPRVGHDLATKQQS